MNQGIFKPHGVSNGIFSILLGTKSCPNFSNCAPTPHPPPPPPLLYFLIKRTSDK